MVMFFLLLLDINYKISFFLYFIQVTMNFFIYSFELSLDVKVISMT